ncbi:MAG: hypothetical protein J0L80_07835 [Chitinophagales bacterium]|nr:hypothetical protein [Chitinophagales bacterium]
MRKLIVTALGGIVFLTTSSTSCKKKNDGNCADVMCTAMFTMINTKVTDANGRYVKLDDVYVMREKNNDIYRPEQQSAAWDSSYVVIDDGYLPKMYNSTETFYFIGIKNGIKVVNEPFVISADCCHVSKQSGKTTIVIP